MDSEDRSEKRGRKRQNNEESLSPAEMEKREKNRKAAKKCRAKKERILTDLKKKNEELQQENKQLYHEKKSLFQKAENFKMMIKDHCKKGCKIPEQFLEMWNKHTIEDFFNEQLIETNSSSPSSPESTNSEILLPLSQGEVHDNCNTNSAAPTALFSGTPLTKSEIVRCRSTSSSSNNSLSPSLVHSSQVFSSSTDGLKNLSQYLTGTKIPAALAPIPSASCKKKDLQTGAIITVSNNGYLTGEIPKNDNELENNFWSIDVTGTADIYSNTIQSNHTTETTMQETGLDEIIVRQISKNYESRGDNFVTEHEVSQNVPPEFYAVIAEGYSYSEDIQQ